MTTIIESSRLALLGMKNVEREIIDQARARQVTVVATDFTWNHGEPLEPVPPIVHMEIRLSPGRAVVTEWLQIYLEDSHERVERTEVHRKIALTVTGLSPKV